MSSHLNQHSRRRSAASKLVGMLHALASTDASGNEDVSQETDVLSAIQELLLVLSSRRPLFAGFHDGQVHNPLGGGAYVFKEGLVGPTILSLMNDEAMMEHRGVHPHLQSPHTLATDPMAEVKNMQPGQVRQCCSTTGQIATNTTLPEQAKTEDDCLHVFNVAQSTCSIQKSFTDLRRPIVVHTGVQPNNSPHAGTLVVFSYAFLLARAIRDEISARGAAMSVTVEATVVDTAPIDHETREIDGIQYQRAYRDDPAALAAHMADYEEVLGRMSEWSGISFKVTFQRDFFSHPELPNLLTYMVDHRPRLASQLSPKYNKIALRAACPIPDCGLAEKHGILNKYTQGSIAFFCPHHGEHSISLSRPLEIARLEANAPTRNLIRSMLHLLDKDTHHIRITGADYAGTYQEALLYRPLAEWSAFGGLCVGRTPHILYAPLIVDWSGAKLSKSLYVCEGGYKTMETMGTDGLLSYARLRSKYGSQGLKRIWGEVERWITEPQNLFRASFSVEYLQAILDGSNW